MAAEFEISPDAVRSIAGNLGGILLQTVTLTRDLERLVVPPTSFGQFGAAVATGGGALADGQTRALRSLLAVVDDVNGQLRRVADSTQQSDQDIATGLGSRSGSLWASPVADRLAQHAMADPAGTGTRSVSGVLGYLHDAGLGELASQPVPPASFDTPTELADWLDADPDHQTRLGVIGIYSGYGGNLSDVPGGVHPGDLVYVARWQLGGADFRAGTEATVGVLGDDGQLYNHGPISTDDWHGVTNLRVYRPLSSAL